MRERDRHDALLDEALKHYADQGADSGLEARMLARLDPFRSVTTAPTRVSRRWTWFAIASPVAACALFIVIAFPGLLHRATAPKPHTDIARVDGDRGSVAALQDQHPKQHAQTPAQHERLRAVPRQVASAAHEPLLPKLAMFPSVPSLTPDERSLLEWQKRAPESVREALAKPLPDPPHDIAAIHIAPLEIPQLGSENLGSE